MCFKIFLVSSHFTHNLEVFHIYVFLSQKTKKFLNLKFSEKVSSRKIVTFKDEKRVAWSQQRELSLETWDRIILNNFGASGRSENKGPHSMFKCFKNYQSKKLLNKMCSFLIWLQIYLYDENKNICKNSLF